MTFVVTLSDVIGLSALALMLVTFGGFCLYVGAIMLRDRWRTWRGERAKAEGRR